MPFDLSFSLVGLTGAGKSTLRHVLLAIFFRTVLTSSQFIEYATQQVGQTIGHELQPGTSDIRAVRCNHPKDGKPVVFVDTPGFGDTFKSNIEILSLVASWLVKV